MQHKLPLPETSLTAEQITAFVQLALHGLSRQYPNQPAHVLRGPQSLHSPQELHPAFYGCFDWHSAVHGHWMLVRLTRLFPGCSSEPRIRHQLRTHLTSDNIAIETAYFTPPENRSFERMYGWAWLLRLTQELHDWNDSEGRIWRDNLRPLEQRICSLIEDYLPRLHFAIRSGVHPNTAFALAQMIDYARAVSNTDLEACLIENIQKYYLDDHNYPTGYEPSGEDFFSPGLNEADCVRRILNPQSYASWLTSFLPDLTTQQDSPFLSPVVVSDITDSRLVHLAGLNFSRAWTLQGIATHLLETDSRRDQLFRVAEVHAQHGQDYLFSGHYGGDHWLATFAIYWYTKVGRKQSRSQHRSS